MQKQQPSAVAFSVGTWENEEEKVAGETKRLDFRLSFHFIACKV